MASIPPGIYMAVELGAPIGTVSSLTEQQIIPSLVVAVPDLQQPLPPQDDEKAKLDARIMALDVKYLTTTYPGFFDAEQVARLVDSMQKYPRDVRGAFAERKIRDTMRKTIELFAGPKISKPKVLEASQPPTKSRIPRFGTIFKR